MTPSVAAGRTRAMNFRSATLVLGWVVIVIIAVIGVRVMGAGAVSCAALPEGSIIESQKFAPAEGIPRPPEVPINPSGGSGTDVSPDRWIPNNTLDGLPLYLVRQGTPGEVVRWFFDRPIDSDLTLSGFLADGGIVFSRSPTTGATAAGLAASLGDRAVPVDIGEYEGVLTWGDPLANGVRPHQLWWSDAEYSHYLLADRSAVTITNLARSMVCGSG